MAAKLLIFSAPSGSGKTTLVHHLLRHFPNIQFSISATSRERRAYETDSKDYHFIHTDQFREKIAAGDFVEWEEVYPGTYYGTLKSEINRILEQGNSVIFDVDVQGGLNIKKQYGPEALAVFVKVASIEILRDRLIGRNTESPEKLAMRLAKAEEEMKFETAFDVVIVNHELEAAKKEAVQLVDTFLNAK